MLHNAGIDYATNSHLTLEGCLEYFAIENLQRKNQIATENLLNF